MNPMDMLGAPTEKVESSTGGGGINRLQIDEKPLLIKLMPILACTLPESLQRDGVSSYHNIPVDHYTHTDPTTGNNYTHPCRQSLGLGDSPEREAKIAAYTNRKKAAEDHGKDSAQYKAADKICELFRSSTKFVFLAIQPNDDKLYMLEAPQTFINYLNGAEARGSRPAYPSRMAEMRQAGANPFVDYKSGGDVNLGWLKVSKTGKRLNTVYTVECDSHKEEVTLQDGTKTTIDRLASHSVAECFTPKAIKDLAGQGTEAFIEFFKNKTPDIIGNKSRFVWSKEDSQKWVDSLGTVVPVRESATSDKPAADLPDLGTVGTQEQSGSVAEAAGISGAMETAEQAPVNANVQTQATDDIPF